MNFKNLKREVKTVQRRYSMWSMSRFLVPGVLMFNGVAMAQNAR